MFKDILQCLFPDNDKTLYAVYEIYLFFPPSEKSKKMLVERQKSPILEE